jgi:hypothetical protein
LYSEVDGISIVGMGISFAAVIGFGWSKASEEITLAIVADCPKRSDDKTLARVRLRTRYACKEGAFGGEGAFGTSKG